MKKLLILVATASFVSIASAMDTELTTLAKAAGSTVIKNPDFYCECKNGTLEPIDSSLQCTRHAYTGDWVWTNKGIKLSCGEDTSDAEKASCDWRCKRSGWAGKVWSKEHKAFVERPSDWEKKPDHKIVHRSVVSHEEPNAAAPTPAAGRKRR